MVEKTGTPTPASVQIRNTGFSDSGSAQAPFVYLDNACAFAYGNGIVQVTLDAGRLVPGPAGELVSDRVVVAHLRMSVPAATSLKAALDAALLLASSPQSLARN